MIRMIFTFKLYTFFTDKRPGSNYASSNNKWRRLTLAEKLKLLYDIFKKAIESEKEAQKMYKEAISLCEDKKTIHVLKSLIRDELRHEEKLIEHYKKLKRELSF